MLALSSLQMADRRLTDVRAGDSLWNTRSMCVCVCETVQTPWTSGFPEQDCWMDVVQTPTNTHI